MMPKSPYAMLFDPTNQLRAVPATRLSLSNLMPLYVGPVPLFETVIAGTPDVGVFTCNTLFGVVVPMPTLPSSLIRILSPMTLLLYVEKVKSESAETARLVLIELILPKSALGVFPNPKLISFPAVILLLDNFNAVVCPDALAKIWSNAPGPAVPMPTLPPAVVTKVLAGVPWLSITPVLFTVRPPANEEVASAVYAL